MRSSPARSASSQAPWRNSGKKARPAKSERLPVMAPGQRVLRTWSFRTSNATAATEAGCSRPPAATNARAPFSVATDLEIQVIVRPFGVAFVDLGVCRPLGRGLGALDELELQGDGVLDACALATLRQLDLRFAARPRGDCDDGFRRAAHGFVPER